jgi:tripartite-type tricarboxylate transporter receptor subunit TctC
MKKSLLLRVLGAALQVFATVALGSIALHAGNACAYPDKPVKLISPYAPGGSNDLVTRLLAKKLGEKLPAPVVVENRPGGGMIIATELVAHAAPDGHTLILVSSGHAINPALGRKLPYDTLRDFAPVSLIGWMPNVLVVHPAFPAKSVAELVELARKAPGTINYASAGNASTPHLAAEWFKSVAGIQMTHVPYKGTGPALTDLLAGNVSLTICGIAPALPHIRSGKLRAIAVTGAKRSALLPALPSVSESGYRGVEVLTWYGVLAPAGTAAEVLSKLSGTIAAAIRTPEAGEQFAVHGIEVLGSTPAEFDAFIRTELQRWNDVVKTSHIHAD